MLSKSFAASVFLLALTSSANANGVISPALGISGSPGSSDVQHPSDAAPCGTIPIAQNLDSSSTIQADGNGKFAPSITNFATGADGSRSIKTAKVDPSGTGNSFVDCQIVTNGDNDPTSQGTQQLAVQFPSGTKCVGGTNKNRCLVSLITTAGDGNCVVVTQSGSNAKRDASGDKEVPKPAPAKDDTTTLPKGHRFQKDKKKASKKPLPLEMRGDMC